MELARSINYEEYDRYAGRALVQEPRLMLLNEPTGSLDLKNTMNILNLIKEVVTTYRLGAVMTMHNLNTALRFAD